MDLPILRGMIRRHRRTRVLELVSELEQWEREGRNLLAALLEITEETDDLAVEARRILETLDG